MFESPPVFTVPVAGDAPFPVRRIYCVGRNYRAHALEMGADPDREEPFFFMKPADAIIASGSAIAYPPRTSDYQHEIELVVAIGKAGHDVSVEDADALVYGYAVGLDMTRRDLQLAARKAGRPWDMGKGFYQSAPCGEIRCKTEAGSLAHAAIRLTVNDKVRQASDLSLLIWSVPELIAELTSYGELLPGDLIYTGTPEGVGPVGPGDHLVGTIEGLADLVLDIRP